MADRPPVFRPPGWRPREPWQRPDGWKDTRKRGRAGQRERQQVLDEEPFCRECLKEGIHRKAAVVDHIVPLAFGGSDDRTNKQALCNPHHNEKSKAEAKRSQYPSHD